MPRFGRSDCAARVLEAEGVASALLRPLRIEPLRALRGADAGSAAAIIRQCGADLFDADEKGAAHLYAGFDWIPSAPERARVELGLALECGADRVEAHRGVCLAREQEVRRSSASFESGARLRRLGKYAAARQRLRSSLAEHGDGLSARFAVSVETAELCASASHAELAREWIAQARADAERLGCVPDAMRNRIDLADVAIRADHDPNAALALASAVVERDPASSAAWQARIECGRKAKHPEVAHWVRQAASATGDRRFVYLARQFRPERRGTAPFFGMVPGQVTAGELAAEAHCWATEATNRNEPVDLGAVWRTASGLRMALPVREREAFDAAVLAVLGILPAPVEPEALIAQIMLEWRGFPAELGRLFLVVALGDLPFALPGAVRDLARSMPVADVLEPAVRAMAAVGDHFDAQQLTGQLSGGLDRGSLQRLLMLAAASPLSDQQPPGRTESSTLDDYDRVLEPEMSLVSLFEGEDSEAQLLEDDLEDADFIPPEMLELLEMYGFDPDGIYALPRDVRDDFAFRLMRILIAGPSARTERELGELARQFGLTAPAHLSRAGRRARTNRGKRGRKR